VVPFFNEEAAIPYFWNTFERMAAELSDSYRLFFVFVDDGSSDKTWELLNQRFQGRPECKLLQHPQNRGVAAAILTGVSNAETELVCSVDSDCTYDPIQLRWMIPALTDDTDMVTGSPYHPQGRVVNVPHWRLGLSRCASILYGWVLGQHLHTYTSCFRVYRRSAVTGLSLEEGGFLGVAELIGKLVLTGHTVRECPVTLEARMLGQSKMKTFKTIGGHLRVLAKLLWLRLAKNETNRQTPGGMSSEAVSETLVAPGVKSK
jgi:glycosyltransferase involved in cell wall biosynthesis